MTPDVIFLDGASSSGKSSLSHALQEILETPYLHIGIDQFIWMMPAKLNNWEGDTAPQGFCWELAKSADDKPLAHLRMGPFAHKISDFLSKRSFWRWTVGTKSLWIRCASHPKPFKGGRIPYQSTALSMWG